MLTVLVALAAAAAQGQAKAPRGLEGLDSLYPELAPDREPTIRTGAAVLALSALELLGKR